MKRRQHKEQDFCTQIGKWWDNVGADKFFPNHLKIEAKVSKENSFNYKSGFKPHQIPTLIRYKNKPMHWKPSDGDVGTKNYDLDCSQPKYIIPCVAIKWIRRGNKTFYLIDPVTIQGRVDDGQKSLTEDEAKSLSFYIGSIK